MYLQDQRLSKCTQSARERPPTIRRRIEVFPTGGGPFSVQACIA